MGAFDEVDWAAYTSASLRDENFGGDLDANLFSIGLERVLWTNPLQNHVQSQQLDTSYNSFEHGRHFSTTSSEFSQKSQNSLPVTQSTTTDEFASYQSPVEPNLTTSLPCSMSNLGNAANEYTGYRASHGQKSSNSSTISAQEYSQEYLTAKERSLLHRRKQNRAAQRTFRQRKELERIELQGRLDAAAETTRNIQNTCEVLNVALEELRKRVKVLESENSMLRRRQDGPEVAEEGLEDKE